MDPAGEGLGSMSDFGRLSGWEPRVESPVRRSWPCPGGRGHCVVLTAGQGDQRACQGGSSLAGASVSVLLLPGLLLSLSCVRLFVTPWPAALQAPLSFTISQSLLKLTSVESSNHLNSREVRRHYWLGWKVACGMAD